MSTRSSFEDYKRSGIANNVTVGVLAVAAMLCGAKSFTGTQISLVEYCFRPRHRHNYCTTNKRYVMPETEFYAETYAPANPEFQRESFLPAKATRLRTIPPSNPDKHWWGLAATVLMIGAYGLSKAREQRLIQLMPEYRESTRTDWQINKLWHGLRLHKEAYSAKVDYEFHQWSENRKARGAQLAAMSPQELAIYQQQVRLQAEVEAQAQLQAINSQPALTGQTLNDVTRSNDKVSGAEQQVITPNDDLAIGQRIVDELVSSKLSTLLAAPSGAGKSVSQAFWVSKLFEKFSDADVYVIARKNDSFNGLKKKGKVFIYDPSSPETALKALEIVHGIFLKRSQYPEHEREQFKTKPVRLILADWYSIHNDLSQCHTKLWNTHVKTKLADIVTVAREFNCSLFADTQTFNITSLGIAEDSNIRNNLNIISQGLVSVDEDGLEQGGFSVLQSIIKNQYVMPDDTARRTFIANCKRLVAISNEQHIPVIFSTTGTAKMGLLPNLMKYKGVDIFATVDGDNNGNSEQAEDAPILSREALEKLYKLKPNIENKAESIPTPYLTPNAQSLLQYLERSRRNKAVIQEVQPNFKVKGQRFSADEVKRMFNELVEASLAVWTDTNTIKISPNQTDRQNGQD
jgi:hypothetical protein